MRQAFEQYSLSDRPWPDLIVNHSLHSTQVREKLTAIAQDHPTFKHPRFAAAGGGRYVNTAPRPYS
jgi:hypothetical protein